RRRYGEQNKAPQDLRGCVLCGLERAWLNSICKAGRKEQYDHCSQLPSRDGRQEIPRSVVKRIQGLGCRGLWRPEGQGIQGWINGRSWSLSHHEDNIVNRFCNQHAWNKDKSRSNISGNGQAKGAWITHPPHFLKINIR